MIPRAVDDVFCEERERVVGEIVDIEVRHIRLRQE